MRCEGLIFLALLLVSVGKGYSQVELIHQWEFNETSGTVLKDAVGDADAELVILPGGGSHEFTGEAVRLEGGSRDQADYVSFPPDIFEGLSDISIEIWTEPHSFPEFGGLFSIGPGDSDPNPYADVLRLVFSIGENGNLPFFGLSP